MSAGGQEHLAARLVRLGFDGRADVVGEALLVNVIPHVVQAVGKPVVDFVPLHSQRHLEAVTGDPVDVVLRVEEVADAQRAFHLQPGEAAQLRVGIAQPAVA